MSAPGPEPPPPTADASAAVAQGSAAAAGAEAAPAVAAFEWPPATRLRYRLEGWYRGSIEGRAQVEWLHQDDRYQVRLEVTAGAPFAPLFTRQMVSAGRVTPEGLSPERYDERTERMLSAPRDVSMQFSADRVTMANGQSRPRPPGVQDTASQFVQLTWLFTTQREPLRVGTSFPMPLALPRSVRTWWFDVVDAAPLATPFGTIETLHVRPRRAEPGGNELTPELWFAPSLQYLPVRIRIRQDEQTYIELMVDHLPEQARR